MHSSGLSDNVLAQICGVRDHISPILLNAIWSRSCRVIKKSWRFYDSIFWRPAGDYEIVTLNNVTVWHAPSRWLHAIVVIEPGRRQRPWHPIFRFVVIDFDDSNVGSSRSRSTSSLCSSDHEHHNHWVTINTICRNVIWIFHLRTFHLRAIHP